MTPHAALIAVLLLFVAASPIAAAASERNLLVNGGFERGYGETCDGWRTDGWILSPGSTTFRWIAPRGGVPGELEIDSRRGNDARWVQNVSLAAGWYRFSVEARAEGTFKFFIGASISILEDNIMSADLRQTQDWQRLAFYLHVGQKGADVEAALRLGGFMQLNLGKAFFRRASVVRVNAPPPGETHVFDLDRIRKQEAVGPIGKPWSLMVTFVLMALATLLGWWLFGRSTPMSAASVASARRSAS